MKRRLRWLREAWTLLRTDSTLDTVAAMLLLAVVVGPFLWALLQERRR
jgi:hypothetical protein